VKSLEKRKYNSEETKKALLDSAEALFTKSGFAATSTEEIAEMAGCSKSQIQYHYKSKENLWKAVIESHLGCFQEAVGKLFEGISTDRESLKECIIEFFNYLKKNPQIISILRWSTIEGAPVDLNLKNITVKTAAEAISEAKKKGFIHEKLDSNYIVYAILGIIFHWFDMRETTSDPLNFDKSIDEADRDYLNTIIKIIYGGMFT